MKVGKIVMDTQESRKDGVTGSAITHDSSPILVALALVLAFVLIFAHGVPESEFFEYVVLVKILI